MSYIPSCSCHRMPYLACYRGNDIFVDIINTIFFSLHNQNLNLFQNFFSKPFFFLVYQYTELAIFPDSTANSFLLIL